MSVIVIEEYSQTYIWSTEINKPKTLTNTGKATVPCWVVQSMKISNTFFGLDFWKTAHAKARGSLGIDMSPINNGPGSTSLHLG